LYKLFEMGYRINEKNIGSITLNGELKKRKRIDKNLTNAEKHLAAMVLNKVYDCMEHDSDLDASIDGGRFTMMLQSDDMIALRELIIKLER
jgi:hypothetical protein